MKNKNDYVLFMDHVFKEYPDPLEKRERTVLHNIRLKVSAGEFITVIGPTGCGKSTLLRLILGSEQPTSGEILVDNHTIDGPSRDRGIVFQKYSLFPHKKVIENVMFGLELEEFGLIKPVFKPLYVKKRRKEFRERAYEYLKRVGLAADAYKYPHELSGGMRQRVAIAQALIMEPSILLMDEPFGALDFTTRQDMQLFILEQWDKTKMTIFFVTHDTEEALYLGTRILVLSQFYTTDEEVEGSKIVDDVGVPGGHPKPTDFKHTKEFNELLAKIRLDGLEPTHRQHITEFDRSHPDAFEIDHTQWNSSNKT